MKFKKQREQFTMLYGKDNKLTEEFCKICDSYEENGINETMLDILIRAHEKTIEKEGVDWWKEYVNK